MRNIKGQFVKGCIQQGSVLFKKGHKIHLGETRSNETKRKISLANKNKHFSPKTEFKKGMTPWNKGKKSVMSSDFYRKIGLLGLKKKNKNKGPTSIEKKVYNELKVRGLLFETQKLINGKFLVDAYIPKLNLIIEADGDYWHGLEDVKKHDKAKNAYLTKCGYNLLRLTGTEINNGNFKNKLNKL